MNKGSYNKNFKSDTMSIEIENEWRSGVLFNNFNNKFDIFDKRSEKNEYYLIIFINAI